ncbi:hypothetical protein MKW98_024558 [Papaver atlanticum]|uniref:Uncharacterized protein n=1 Tax=Papaver atlanticum TaxID=357466 RepID=A0AAD4S7Z8_9MAGN|nr:hypothetical protein MKW98_024558 [Papaver atlanticum]
MECENNRNENGVKSMDIDEMATEDQELMISCNGGGGGGEEGAESDGGGSGEEGSESDSDSESDTDVSFYFSSYLFLLSLAYSV